MLNGFDAVLEERLKHAEQAELEVTRLQPLASEAPQLRADKVKAQKAAERQRARETAMHQAKEAVEAGTERQLRVPELLGTAARAVGAPPWRIVFRHIMPNCFATYLILATYYLGFAIVIEASLSFLGVGSPPDIPSWGGMLTRAAQEHVKTAPWLSIVPGLAIFLTVLSISLIGDGLNDALNPKLRYR